MNRFYSARNRADRGMFIVAANEDRAREIAKAFNLVRDPYNAHIIDRTDVFMTEIHEMPTLLAGPEGWAVKNLTAGRWEVKEVADESTE